MSCIAGFVAIGDDAAPHSPAVTPMLEAMAVRAPDGNEVLVRGPVILGQAFLRTGTSTSEAPHRSTLDGKTWIVADARIDAREELREQLRRAGRAVTGDPPHAEWILHAHAAFGDSFLDHLQGDFAFALWDEARQTLVCARDHFGIRPFHYARVAGGLAFASQLDALLTLPQVSRELDDVSVADFLLFGQLLDPAKSIYRDVQDLAPAHRLCVTRRGVELQRYWEFKLPPEVRYPRMSDYVERFAELFSRAVQDRVPEGPLALQLSGGMDSTSIAVEAVAAARDSGQPVIGLHFASVLIEPGDDEHRFARIVADSLGITLVVRDLGDHPLFAEASDPRARMASPMAYPHTGTLLDVQRDLVASGARVLLSGFNGDAALSHGLGYYAALARSGNWLKFMREVGHHLLLTRSARGLGLRGLFHRRSAPPDWIPAMPDWISPATLPHSWLQERWDRWWRDYLSADDCIAQLRQGWIHRQFEAAEALSGPVVVRYPFHDLRLLNFLNAAPNFVKPDKKVLRHAMEGRLPPAILARPKVGAAGDPVRTLVTIGNIRPENLMPVGVASAHIAEQKYRMAWNSYQQGQGADSTWTSWLMIHPIAFNIWLSQQRSGAHA